MEPAVEQLLLHGAPTSSDVSSSTAGSLFPADSSGSADALAMLLGGPDAVAPFLTGIWECSAWHCCSNPQKEPAQAQQQQQQACQSAQHVTAAIMPGCSQTSDWSQSVYAGQHQQHCCLQQQHQHQQAGSASAGAAWLALLSQELSVAGLFGELLAAGLHCPVMGVEETDAVQVSAIGRNSTSCMN